VNVGKQCVANYVRLIIVKIYNKMEDIVLRICLLDRASTVLQDINSVQKNVYLPLTFTMRNSFGFCLNVNSMQRNAI